MADSKPQRIVMKFGGTSMAGTERIRRVAGLVRAQAAGKDGQRNEVAVVVSAMAGETDRLVNLCREANPLYDPAEYDVVVASGEQVTSGLLALTLQSLGEKARSWLGWQIPVRTIEAHSKARVETIDAPGMIESLESSEVAVIPGFQGVSHKGRISTMGRGGSDTSAVAVAAAIGADRCDIYTDVDGVYTTDPRIVAKARKLKAVTYDVKAGSFARVFALIARSLGTADLGVPFYPLAAFDFPTYAEEDIPDELAAVAVTKPGSRKA